MKKGTILLAVIFTAGVNFSRAGEIERLNDSSSDLSKTTLSDLQKNDMDQTTALETSIPQAAAVATDSFQPVKTAEDLPPNRKVKGIGFSHAGTPFNIPYFSLSQIARLMKKAGATHYRPHMPLNEALPVIYKADMARLKQAVNDPKLLDQMIDELSKNGHWDRMDNLVNTFTNRGIKLILVAGAGYRKEAPLYEKENGATQQISPDRVGHELYITFLKWAVGAGVRRYADRVFVWQLENELNGTTLPMAVNWRIRELSWVTSNFHRHLMHELAVLVHNEGARRDIPLRTTHNYPTSLPGWERYVKFGQDDGIDIVGLDLYNNYYLGLPINDNMAKTVAKAKEISGGRPVWILETGYARAPLVPNLFSPDSQALYFKMLFDSCFRAGADVILAFGWFWEPHGWFTDAPWLPTPGSPLACEPYWSPIEMRAGVNGKEVPYFNPAWHEFEKAAAKWL